MSTGAGNGAALAPRSPDVTSSSVYADGVPYDRFAEMRATPGLVWHPYGEDGFWAVTRHEEIRLVSRQPEIYSSAVGHTNLWDLEADALEARRSLIDTDAPDHTRLRRLVARAFTPKNIRRWEHTVRSITGQLLDEFIDAGEGDWVESVAAPLPIRVILTLLGVPVEDSAYLVELSNHLVEGTTDRPTLAADAYGNTTDPRLLPFNSPASHALFTYGEQLGDQRRAEPQDDLVTMLVQAADDGDRLRPEEYRNLFHILVFAGNETTRTAITHGVMALADHPEQWQRVLDDRSLVEPAVEEILRWSTPVLHMRRTTTGPTELAGTAIEGGQKVVMWYASGNRDEAVFDDPTAFDVGRVDNPHQAFGGGGPHLCLGAFLARLELIVLLQEMADRGLRLRRTGDAVRVPSNFVNGVLSVPMAVVA